MTTNKDSIFGEDTIIVFPEGTPTDKLTHEYHPHRFNAEGNIIDFDEVRRLIASLKSDVEAWYLEKEGKLVRTFSPDVEEDELKWHQDLKDRKVTVIEGNGWLFQMENELPNKLENAKQIFIPKLAWHRVLKGSGNLIVEIEEFD